MVFCGKEIKKLLDKKVDYIGFDIDGGNVSKLLRLYFALKKVFPRSKIDVYVSSSRRGFHVIVRKKVSVLENLYWRALLGDDNIRISLNLRKMFSNPNESFNDVLFDIKKGKHRVKINLEKILSKHSELVKKYLEHKRWEDLIVLSDLVRMELPIIKKWIVCIPFNEEKFFEIEEICESCGFDYSIFQSYYPDSDHLLVVFSKARDDAVRIGNFFKKELGLLFWVKEIY